MPTLAELQEGFAAVVTGADPSPGLLASIASGRISAASRLDVYRNHYRITLAEALAANFPVVRALVGEAFFAAAARRFLDATPPRQPVLAEYGQALADFLDVLPEAAEVPYLGDVARLEWLMLRAYQAEAAAPLTAIALAAMDPAQAARVRLCLHPAAALLQSPYPVHRIWSLHQPGCDDPPVSLDEGAVDLLVGRTGGEVMWRVLQPAEAAFLAAARDSATLGDACQSVLAAGGHPGVVLGQLLADESLTIPVDSRNTGETTS